MFTCATIRLCCASVRNTSLKTSKNAVVKEERCALYVYRYFRLPFLLLEGLEGKDTSYTPALVRSSLYCVA